MYEKYKDEKMKKRVLSIVLVLSMMALQGCTALSQAKEKSYYVCPDCGYKWTLGENGEIIPVEQFEEVIERATEQETESTSTEMTQSVGETVETESTTQTVVAETETQQTETENQEEQKSTVSQLTEGERQARKQLQADLRKARAELYKQPNSVDKVQQINQLDQQILSYNAYDFGDKTVQFIGDSITEAITAAYAEDGTKLTYVEYANRYLQIGDLITNGKAGRMYTNYGGEEYSVVQSIDNNVYFDADVYVVFLGVNDYLVVPPNDPKRYGNINDTMSTAGYCGAVRQFMNHMKRYFADREVIFVMMYPLNRTVTCQYSDITTQPTLNDYLDIQRQLAKENGFHVIDLYADGFMDCTNAEVNNYYLTDGIHPSDAGYKVLGEHIAAELSLYLGQK